MPSVTAPYCNRLAIVFDYDDTLAPDSLAALLDSLNVDRDAFKASYTRPLEEDGWDAILARFYGLIQLSRDLGKRTITRDRLERIGEETEFFDGVPKMFDRLRETARALDVEVEVEFYLLSSGIIEIARATSIASEFEQMWGCEFHFNERDEATFLKQIITHPEKPRYLLKLSKGADWKGDESENVYREVSPENLHVPLDQMVFVGDGASDMPAFRLMDDYDGLGIGVIVDADSADEWRGHDDMHAGRRVQNLAPADYDEDSELMHSLRLAIESIGKRIALRKMSAEE